MLRHCWTIAVVVTVVNFSSDAQKAWAQFGAVHTGGPPTVSSSGTAVIERQPELLRMEIDVLAKGKDLKDALGKLKQRRKAAEEQLTKLGADATSVKFGIPRISPPENDQQKQMQMMMRQRMMQRRVARRPTEKPVAAPPVTVSISLTAEWPLKAGDAEPLLIASHELEENIRAADLAGRKAAEELSPEEEELAEESEGDEEQTMYYGGQQQPKPGEPRFIYVSTISENDRAKAFAEAFERAKVEAGALAKAASAELGDLLQLGGGNESSTDPEMYDQWTNYRYRMLQQAQRISSDDKVEAIGAQPGMLKYQVSVTATFALK